MKLRTEVKIEKQLGFFDHGHSIIGMGSCFATNISAYLKLRNFEVINNPMGILFNPYSIANRINASFSGDFNENLFVERDEHIFHYDFHSSLGMKTRKDLEEFVKNGQSELKKELSRADRLILTFGTAWVYRYRSENEIVANCHKVPQKEFVKELLDLEELKNQYTLLFQRLKDENPKIEIVLTVSPVRHVKNGLHENNLSKSILLLLTRFLSGKFEFVSYFPAYELVMDDLRDYRFFNADLVHPNDMAIDYVYERFQEAYFSEKTIEIADLSMKLIRLLGHSTMHPSKDQIKKKRLKEEELKEKIERLKREF